MELDVLIKDCIETFNLDSNVLRDISFAICTADKIYGTNQRELDVDKFVNSDSELNWGNVLSLLGIDSSHSSGVSLPRVQRLRVISDMLSLSVTDKVKGLSLTCKATSYVAKELGVSLPSVEYADEDFCYENIAKIERVVKEQSFVADKEVQEMLDLLSNYPSLKDSGITLLDERYENVNNLFKACKADVFNKKDFFMDLNCFMLSKLVALGDSKWVCFYSLLDTAKELLGGEKLVCCVTSEMQSKLRRCFRLNNSLELISVYSSSNYDSRFTKVLLLAMYSPKFVDDFKKYVLGGD